MHLRCAFYLTMAAFLFATTAGAQSVYMWKDSKGSMHITNDPPPAGAQKIDIMDATPPPPDAEQPPATEDAAPQPNQEAPGLEAPSAEEQKAKANAARLAEITRELDSLQIQHDDLSRRYLKARNIDYSRAVKLNIASQLEKVDARINELQEEAAKLK